MKNNAAVVCVVLAMTAAVLIPSASIASGLVKAGMGSGSTWPAHTGAGSPGSGSQDQKQGDSQSIKLKANLVEIHAVVTDRGGKLIDNLNKEDFELLENGARQEITFFSIERVGATPGEGRTTDAPKPAGPSPARPSAGRVIVLFADNLHMSAASLAAVKKQLREFVDEQMTARDTVLILTSAGSLGTLQRFTNDRNILRQAIDKIPLRGSALPSSFTPYFAAKILENGNPDPQTLSLALQILMKEEGYVPCNCRADLTYVTQRAAQVLAAEANERRSTLGTLKAICDRLADLPGQRLVAFASDGFTIFDESGRRDTLDLSSVTSHAALHGVVIYSLGAQGLAAPADTVITGPDVVTALADSRLEQQQLMRTLAGDTGGEAFLNTNNMNKSLQTMLDNNRTYYTLAYYPADDKDQKKMRGIAVRVKNHPDYVVRAQKGYLPAERKSEEAATLTPQQKLFRAITSPVPATTIGIISGATYLERESDGSQVTVTLHIDAGALEYEHQGDNYLLHCEVAGSAFDRDGKVAANFAESIQGSLTPAQLEQVKAKGYRYTTHLELKPGLYDVRVGVMEGDGARIGTSTTSIDVPDLTTGKLALSSIILGKPLEEEPPIEMLLAKLAPGTPSFKTGATASYHLVVYNLEPDGEPDTTVTADILQGQKVVGTSSHLLAHNDTAARENGMEIGGVLELHLAPGNYTLRVTVKNPKSKAAAEQTVDFQIEQ